MSNRGAEKSSSGWTVLGPVGLNRAMGVRTVLRGASDPEIARVGLRIAKWSSGWLREVEKRQAGSLSSLRVLSRRQ